MKYALFLMLAALVVPLANHLRHNSNRRLVVFSLAAFLPFVLSTMHLRWAIIDWRWVGYVKGAEISLLDFISLSLCLSLPPAEGRLPFRRSMTIYLATVLLSATQAMFPEAALFYAWQLLRMFLVYVTVYRGVCADQRVPSSIMKGLAAGIFVELAVAGWQHAHGILRTPGTFSSENLLGVISQFVIFPFFAVLLGGSRGVLAPAVVAGGLVIAVLTASRGAILLDCVGLVGVFVLSTRRQWTPRKVKVLWAGVLIAAVFANFAISALQERFDSGGHALGLVQQDSERVRFQKAAALMLEDHPMGVGANNFVITANLGGYYTRVGELWSFGRETNVHNVYWLVAAETGYIGLVAFVAFLLSPLIVALRSSCRNRADARGELMLGLGVALMVVYIHSFEEWIFVVFDTQYLFAMVLGMVAGLARELKYWPSGADVGSGGAQVGRPAALL